MSNQSTFLVFFFKKVCYIKDFLYLCSNRTRLHPIRTASESFFIYKTYESETKNHTRTIDQTQRKGYGIQ